MRDLQETKRTEEWGEPLSSVAERLFFVVGCGRSGTTLLQVMLSNHPEIALPNETGFYSLIRRKNLRRLGEADTPRRFRAAFEAALEFWRIRELGLDRERVWELCQRGAPSWETLFLGILAAIAEDRGAIRVGEKSPGHFEHLGLLSRRFPQAQFIQMFRDPRGVVGSFHRTFGTRLIGAKCKRWKHAYEQHVKYRDLLGDRYLAVKYEDLVQAPEQELRRVCTFLDASFEPEMLEYHDRKHLGFAKHQIHHMANTLKPVFTSSIDKWQKELSTAQIALVEGALAEEMQHLGYASTGARSSFARTRYRAHLLLEPGARAVQKVGKILGLNQRERIRKAAK